MRSSTITGVLFESPRTSIKHNSSAIHFTYMTQFPKSDPQQMSFLIYMSIFLENYINVVFIVVVVNNLHSLPIWESSLQEISKKWTFINVYEVQKRVCHFKYFSTKQQLHLSPNIFLFERFSLEITVGVGDMELAKLYSQYASCKSKS